jgi:hypothetical protein
MKAQKEPSGDYREKQAQRQARKPGWEEGAQNVERGSPSAASQEERREG